jgi:hypothetical protein
LSATAIGVQNAEVTQSPTAKKLTIVATLTLHRDRSQWIDFIQIKQEISRIIGRTNATLSFRLRPTTTRVNTHTGSTGYIEYKIAV